MLSLVFNNNSPFTFDFLICLFAAASFLERYHDLDTQEDNQLGYNVSGVKFCNYLGFSYFQFKIRLIRLGLPFQKTKIPTGFPSGVITITPKSQR